MVFYHKRHLITPQQLLSSGHHQLLAKRLGYLGEADFCINGFTFWPDIEKTTDGYYNDLDFGPEVIGCIGRYIGNELWREYRKKTKYYGVVFKVPVNEIIFDGVDGIETQEDKVPDAVHEAAKEVNETLKEYCQALMDTGVNGIMIDTLFASGSILSKEMWDELEGDLVEDLAAAIREKNGMVMIHNCGERIYFDAQIKRMQPEVISFLYPPDDCKDFKECKEKYGDVTTLIGCVTPASAVIGTDEEGDQECRDSIDAMAKGGGFVLATGCEYPANASFDRAQRMVEIAKTYGKYE